MAAPAEKCCSSNFDSWLMCQWSIENKSISAAQLKDEREKLVSLSFKLAFYFAVEAF